jgi:membrane associated rhomboid family serine protease
MKLLVLLETIALTCAFSPSSSRRDVTTLAITRQSLPTSRYDRKGDFWDGDDLRWSSRLTRRIAKHFKTNRNTPVRDVIIFSNVMMYCYQAATTLRYLVHTYPSFWPSWDLFSDSCIDAGSVMGPLTRSFMFSAYLGKKEPHRYITSGFLHGGIIHLACNLYALQKMPKWLEIDLGWPLFLTTYLTGIVVGNYFHARYIMDEFLGSLGASGGILALSGLSFIALAKMNNKPATLQVLKNTAFLILLGILIPDLSNASHIGGFISGSLMGLFFSPGYRKSYSLRRKNSNSFDTASKEFRQVMGFGIVPNDKPPLPVGALWAFFLVYAFNDRRFRLMPKLIWRGLTLRGNI